MEDRLDAKHPYVLSALLQGHTDDVRSLCTDATSTLFSASRDATARAWRKASTDWEEERSWMGHEGFVNAVTWLPKDAQGGESKGYLVTGGQDTLIQVFDLDADSSEPVQTLLGHGQNVCCLHTSGTTIVSGSWDYTARLWDTGTWTCTRILTHKAAVWDVLALSLTGYEDAAVTACADGYVRLFNKSSDVSVLFKGHRGPVRALAKLLPEDPECNLFASASNDCHIIIWNLQGDMVTTLSGHESFIYALVSIPASQGGGLASSGEEGVVKIWDEEEGEEEQELVVPALSVWSLATMPNGDLAIACSDNMIWVFTRDIARKAEPSLLEVFKSRLEARKPRTTSSRPALPTSTADDLTRPGVKEGEVKLVEADGVTRAHQWSEGNWVLLGEVTSGDAAGSADAKTGRRSKTSFEGAEYDAVIDIDYKDDEPPLKLPYNLEDSAHDVAEAFVAKHGLPESYAERIEAYLKSL